MTAIRKLTSVTIPTLTLGCASLAFASDFRADTAADLPAPSSLIVSGADYSEGSSGATGASESGAVVMNMWQQTSSAPRTIRWW